MKEKKRSKRNFFFYGGSSDLEHDGARTLVTIRALCSVLYLVLLYW